MQDETTKKPLPLTGSGGLELTREVSDEKNGVDGGVGIGDGIGSGESAFEQRI